MSDRPTPNKNVVTAAKPPMFPSKQRQINPYTAEMPPRQGENESRMVSTIEITLNKE